MSEDLQPLSKVGTPNYYPTSIKKIWRETINYLLARKQIYAIDVQVLINAFDDLIIIQDMKEALRNMKPTDKDYFKILEKKGVLQRQFDKTMKDYGATPITRNRLQLEEIEIENNTTDNEGLL